MSDLTRLRELMRRLRDPLTGCPWDRAQTFASVVPHTLEEAYELADAIERAVPGDIAAELGDLLFQVVFYAQLAEEAGMFSLDSVVSGFEDKLVRRHPHVFGAAPDVAGVEAVHARWEADKARERRARGTAVSSELDDVPLALPALTRARKLQQRAARVGFDWPTAAGAWAKLHEELAEAERAIASGDAGAIDDELGDLLFAVVNVARHHGCDPEALLRAANAKFERRFRHVETALAARGVAVEDAAPEVLDALWEAAKSALLNDRV